jgi:hypothetical protein
VPVPLCQAKWQRLESRGSAARPMATNGRRPGTVTAASRLLPFFSPTPSAWESQAMRKALG